MNPPFLPGEEDPSQHASPICTEEENHLQVAHHTRDAILLYFSFKCCVRYIDWSLSEWTGGKYTTQASPFNSQVTVAAATVASWFPTPTPLRDAWVARVPDRELEKAWGRRRDSFSLMEMMMIVVVIVCFPLLYLHCVPELVLQVVITDTVRVSLRQEDALKRKVYQFKCQACANKAAAWKWSDFLLWKPRLQSFLLFLPRLRLSLSAQLRPVLNTSRPPYCHISPWPTPPRRCPAPFRLN